MPRRRRDGITSDDVFLNIPFDKKYEQLYLALIAGLCGMGLTPRCVLEVPAGVGNRLDRLFALVRQCGSSIHDLSRVELSVDQPRCPRFNMPFELGLAVAVTLSRGVHQWFVFEARPFRLQKSLSDVNGFDPYIHNGTPEGVLRELSNVFVMHRTKPSFASLELLYRQLKRFAVTPKAEEKVDTLFTPSCFRALVTTGQEIATRLGLLRED